VRDLNGSFRRSVTLPGSSDASAPRVIAGQDFGAENVVRLGAETFLELGFGEGDDLLVARISGQAAAEWLLVVRGAFGSQSEARLALYVDVLGRALGTVAGVESSQLTWAMLLHLMQTEQPPQVAAERAVDEISAALKAEASFALFLRESCTFCVGPSATELLAPPADTTDWLALPVKVAMPYRAMIGVRRGGEHPLTRADEKLLQSAGLTMAFWLNGVIEALPGGAERRNPKSFEQVIDQQVAESVGRGDEVSLVVIGFGPRTSMTPPSRGWIAAIRAVLRPGDLTGWLTGGDIGVLLPATSPEGARLVIERLRSVLLSDTSVNASFSLASRGPGSSTTSSLLADAAPAPRSLVSGNGH
jgi:hypothetical protein